MRVAMIVGGFPLVSETFILRQITGLIDLGHEVDIFAERRPPEGSPCHPEVERYNLLSRTTYLNLPPATEAEISVWPFYGRTWPPGSDRSVWNVRRILDAVPSLTKCLRSAPLLTWNAVRKAEFGYQASSLSSVYRLAALCHSREQYDVVHVHFGPVGSNFRFARSLFRAPMMVSFHGYDFTVWPQEHGGEGHRQLHRLLNMIDAVTVNCDYMRKRVSELGCAPQRIRILHSGMNPDEFPFRDRVRRTGEPLRILTVGRLVEKKGLEYAIRAIAQARARGLEVHYDIVGDGPLRQALSSLIDELGVRQQFVLHGARNSRFIREIMSEAHLFMLTSVTAANGDQEGTPNSLMEAQATGLPVVSTRHSGIPETVLDGKSGVLVAERDVTALTEALLRLAAQPDVCREMGREGRRHVEAQFDIRKLSRDLAGLYEEMHASSCFVKRD